MCIGITWDVLVSEENGVLVHLCNVLMCGYAANLSLCGLD